MYFPFFKPQTGGKRSATQPQTICSEFPLSGFIIQRGDEKSRRRYIIRQKMRKNPRWANHRGFSLGVWKEER
ncbi:MAG: hypothetical protein EGQ87_07425 [Clostridiales bacterium]|nr:hypothetical protein [Clostridiales bacterium]